MASVLKCLTPEDDKWLQFSSNTDPLTSLPLTKEKSETWMWVWPKTQTQMLLCPAMGLSPTILHQQHHQEPTNKVLREREKKKKDEEGEL